MRYSKTIFRFPLRKKPSDLSRALYDVSKVDALINALREEAKLLLVFLRSVDTIEVVNISEDGHQQLSFKVEISDEFKRAVGCDRRSLLGSLKSEYRSKSYNISRYFDYTSNFNTKVSGVDLNEGESGESSWLVCNQVGSDNEAVLEAAVKQKIFPWVGVALELKEITKTGRIFCFLPLPIEAASNLPVHVNGTFVPTDDRRSLKWPGVERKNDAKADWNMMLVKAILPRCYVTLLQEAKNHLSSVQFYKAWPCENIIDKNTWGMLLKPMYRSLFEHPMFWSETSREWVEASVGVFVQKDAELDEVIHQCLSSCDVKVVCIKQCDNVWAALKLAGVKVTLVLPKMVRDRLRYSTTYMSLGRDEKCAILDYCLSDRQYSDLVGLHLLPLLNGKFAQIREDVPEVTRVFVASEPYPSILLPNLTHMLIDLADENLSLHKKISKLADSQVTQVKSISQKEMLDLLDKTMPDSWNNFELIPLPDPSFPVEWFELFWNWAEKKKLNTFVGKFILPVAPRRNYAQNPEVKFCIIKLPTPKDAKAASLKGATLKDTTSKAVIYIPSGHECSGILKDALDRFDISICSQDDFPYVKHKSLSTYLEQFDSSGMLDAMDLTPNCSEVKLTTSEAEALRDFIKPIGLSRRKRVLEKLSIFTTASNTKFSLLSVYQAKSNSTFKKAVVEPQNTCIDISKLPSSMIMFHNDQSQIQLLKNMDVYCPNDNQFILNCLFPALEESTLSNVLRDEIMICILDNFHALRAFDRVAITTKLTNFPFVKTSANSDTCECPKHLYDPGNCEIAEILKGERLFPISPYDKEEYLDVLKLCGLQTVIKSDRILDVIRTIGTPPSSKPKRVDKAKFTRAKTVLQYICKDEFLHSLGNQQKFRNDIKKLSTEKGWIPVLSAPPSILNYPSTLPWKGTGCNSHLMSLQAHPYYILSTTDCTRVPLLVGSEMYFSDPPVIANVADIFPPSCSNITKFTVFHLLHLKELNPDTCSISNQLSLLYQELARPANRDQVKQYRDSLSRWLYIPKHRRFVSPSAVAIEPDPTFRRHNLEPYIYLLPEQFADFKELFLEFGMHRQISESQIISVLEKIRREICRKELAINPSEASDLIMSILNWLTKNGSRDISNLVQETDIYIPVDSHSSTDDLQLENARNVVYSDSDFLKKFATSESESALLFSHPSIHQKLAECLGLRLLSEKMDISKDAFEDTGQHEPLMQRLKNILKGFKDGLTIIKELLQNADDAEATEFNICYDSRFHNTKKERLFFPGMSQVHGPALVVHNNKTFSDEDFINITKLAGATKEKKQLKIGKFGEGFCSVYHITDVPSFASRDQLHIFDPTLTCLYKEVNNLQRPGKKMKFTTKIVSQSDQLNPYVGLFGFERTSSFKGTLFRLPFRTCTSELSSKCYNEETITELIGEMKKCASKLLLFLQHVNHMTFWRIDQGEVKPKVLFEISKSSVSAMESLPRHTRLLSIALLSPTQSSADTSEHWLVAKMDRTIDSKRATASVACSLRRVTSSTYSVIRDLEGEVFCFLPLSQHTGLPVHVSGNFAVKNNRQGIWTSDEIRGETVFEVRWNVNIMKNVVPRAYLLLLVTLQGMHTRNLINDYLFYGLWPLQSSLTIPFELLPPLYQLMTKKPLLLSADSKWLCLSQSKILKPGVLSLQSDIETPECVLEILTHLDIPLVYMPSKYHQCLSLQLDNDTLITEEKFITLFFQKLREFEGIKDARNKVLLILLKVYAAEYVSNPDRSIFLHGFLKSNPCIPTSPDGAVLRRCVELIYPDSQFASLYDKSDHCFPDEKLAEQQFSHTVFLNLGMIRDEIPWSMLIERAKTIPIVLKENKVRALQRVKTILKCIDSKSSETHPMISKVPFLPVVPKPDGCHLSWKGEDTELSSGSKLVLARKWDAHYDSGDNTDIAGSQVLFVCENPPEKGGCGSISQDAIQKLQIRAYPTSSSVVNHLKEVIRVYSTENPQWIEKVCNHIYSFLDKEIHHAKEKEIPSFSELKKIPCIWNGTNFIYTQQVAKYWKMNGPYLFAVPPGLLAHKYLCEALQIKEEFSSEDVISALEEMKKKFGGKVLDEEHKTIFKQLVPLLDTIKPKKSDFKVLLPDASFILCWSDKLVYNDTKFASHDDKYVYVHDIISRTLAIQFNIKFVSSEMLDKYSIKETSHFAGIEFGQSEKLTVRVKNILLGYPFDVTVLKELLQNADDAKATKMYVILDKRFHGKEAVFSEKWQKLQGPALLVWNNSAFSRDDLKGIQKLGIGSKRGDFESIGQYGIGFNVVYHLTDCPSFVTDDSLCIFDPHCHFIGGATQKDPGRMLSAEIWEKYLDIKSAYLQSFEVQDFCKIQGGSLFRFPLRHTMELLEMSEIVGHGENNVITAKKMHEILRSWAPQMKNAMIFLNHVTEMKVFVIEDDMKIVTECHFGTRVSKAAQKDRDQLHTNVSRFKSKRSKSYIIHYPMTLELRLGREAVEENWIVQQGVGDINVQDREWKLVKRIKPKHGIAAPFNKISSPSCATEEKGSFTGQVFCFLPLPIESKLPVHINGSFVLNSTRLDLFSTPNTDETHWNENLMKAVASSYEKFLTNITEYIFSEPIYTSWPLLESRILDYYNLFPSMRANYLEQRWLSLAQDVYSKLVKSKAQIIIVIETDFIQLTSSTERSKVLRVHSYSCCTDSSMVYFWKEDNKKNIRPILEKLGMVITSAPLSLMDALNAVHRKTKCGTEILAISPQTVCMYYMENYSRCSRSGFPCAISESSFETVENFKQFTLYTLCEGRECTFTESPFGYPLLLTEDEQLRNFDENNKVVKSGFSDVFSQACQSKFVHHEMLGVPYSSSYFATPADKKECLKVILGIFQMHIPEVLHSQKSVNNSAGKILSKDAQKKLWKCLTEDETYKEFLHVIIEEFAIIPSTSDELFSSRSPLKPLSASTEDFQQHAAAIEDLKSIGVPFVDDDIVCTEIGSPHWNDFDKLLETLFHLFQKSDCTRPMNELIAGRIINLVKNNNFRMEKIRKFATSLPLYETIDGKFTALHKCVHVRKWPSQNVVCETAYHKWAQHVDATFLKPKASWTDLASPEDLGIGTISAEEIYMQYVFPHFSSFTDNERFIHLKHIRDQLHRHNKQGMSQSYDPSKQKISIDFIKALNNLKCLTADSTLRRVSEFCNHNEPIFRTFSHQFLFLPTRYREEEDKAKWIELFNDMGLRQTVSKEEYLKFCTEVSEGCHRHLSEASEVLVQYLFSSVVHNWQEDTEFLRQVSEISFVVVKVMKSFNWIAKQANSNILSFVDGNTIVKFAAPFLCALPGCSKLLWTVKPIVNFHLPQIQTQAIFQGLKVTEDAFPADVITNVRNICAGSSLTNFSLFNAYPETLRPPEDVTGLMDVMLEIFQYLMMKSSEYDVSTLRSLPCVPVPSTPEAKIKWQWVLVKPCFVLSCRVDDLHPYLHRLPDELLCVSPLMVKMGVKNGIELSHIQAVLSEAYSQTDGVKMEANTRTCVTEAVKHLKKILQDEQENVKEILSPLYLPSSEGKLHLSTDMVYIDASAYNKGRIHLEMQHTPYAELQILPHSYGFTSSDLCIILPEEIRPKKMSELCEQHVISSCEEVADTSVTSKIKITLKLSLIPEAVLKIFTHYVRDEDIEAKLQSFLAEFLSNIKVLTVENLKTTIKLKNTGEAIGEGTVKFFFQNEDNSQCCLYLDSTINVPFNEKVIHDLSDYILLELTKVHPNTASEVIKQIRDMLVLLFNAQTDSQVEEVLKTEGINIANHFHDMEFPMPELGKEIPVCWHHRLDQDIDNIFYPTEWVGYEVQENHIIFVQVGYPILPGEHADFDTIPRLQMTYTIHTRRDDLDGTPVSGLDLLKFIRGRATLRATDDEESAVDEFDEEYLESTKEKILQELKDIWQLPVQLKKKAVKRLYLKWQNPDDSELTFSGKVFKFLLSEIKCLEEQNNSPQYGQVPSCRLSYDYPSWQGTAENLSYWRRQKHSHERFQAKFFPFGHLDSNKKEGWRWVKQADVDYMMLVKNNDLAQTDPNLQGYGLVCFLSHQVSEKALQGGVCAICGKDERKITDHSLIRRAHMLQARKPGQTIGLQHHVSILDKYYLNTRYPNCWEQYADIPADHFTASQANSALDSAKFVLEMVKYLMPIVINNT